MKHLRRTILLSTLALSLACAAFAQAPGSRGTWTAGPHASEPPVAWSWNGGSSEKAIAVEKNVSLALCVTQGTVKVNGWNRNEVRVMVDEGSAFAFKSQAKGPAGLPALVSVVGGEMKARSPFGGDCIWGETIEIDVPIGAVLTLKGKEIHTTIDTIRKGSVSVIGGDIVFRNVTEGVSASTGQGDISVENSTGPMTLETTTGNVVVFDCSPREIGDPFKAKTTSGNLSLQQVGYRQLDVNSISGSITLSGEVIDGAAYSIGSSNGSIRLQMPQTSNFQLSAVFASGNFDTEIPYKLITENLSPGSVKNINARFGKGGESLIKLTSGNGSILIRKL